MKLHILLFIFFTQIALAQTPAYYNDVNLSLTGADLKTALATKIINTHTNELTYDEIWNASQITDVNPNNNSEVILIYGYEDGIDDDITNDKVSGIDNYPSGPGKWNREHVYSNSLATPKLDDISKNGAPYADAHNLRPCNNQRNPSRGNRKFSNSTGSASGETDQSYINSLGNTQTGWFPGDEWKGDVARMMMYMFLRYGNQTPPTDVGLVVDSSIDYGDMIDLFLIWNVEDPVSAFELERNTYHESNGLYAQGNRNPFIDNPYFATQIWGGPQAEDKFGNVTDTESPTTPTNVTSSLIRDTSFYLSWTASSDNAFVTGYKIFLNTIEVGTSSSTNYNVTGLTSSTNYTVTIKAYDSTGNTSIASSPITVNTLDTQSQILTESFDDDSKFTKSETFFNDGISDYFGILDPSDGSSNDFDSNSTNNTPTDLQTFTGNEANYLRGEDLDGEGNSKTQVLTWSNLNIIGYTNLNFSVKLGASNGFDNNSGGQDEITLAVSIDGGGYTDISKFVVVSGSNQFPTDGTTTLGFAMQTIIGNISNTGSSMNLRLTLRADADNEEFAVDDLVIEGTASAAPTIGFNNATSSETEIDATFTSANIPITVSNYSGSQIDINIDVTGGTAEAGDYTFTSPTALSFTANETQNITVDINQDTDDFDDETIIFTITETSSVSGLIISQSTHTLTIADDETAPSVGFDASTSTETETDATFTSANIPITVGNYSGSQIDINVDVTGGTAEAEDYTFTSPTALSFTANETQNITIDINEDTDDFDDETIIFTITETSSVSGLIISQSTHTLTITEDESVIVPTVGSLFISEVSDASSSGNEFIEIFNNSGSSISMSSSKLVMLSSGGSVETIWDFDDDIGTATIPSGGFLIITRGNNQTTFEEAFGSLNANTVFIQGTSAMYFGTGTARRWRIYEGGSVSTANGTLIDDTDSSVGGSNTRHYQNIFTGTYNSDSRDNASPGELEYLLYTGDAWVNSTAMDGSTGAQDAYIFSDYTITSDVDVNNLGINTGTTLTLNSSTSLDVNSDLTINGNFNINSGGSLKVNGSSTGNITYNRTLATDNWYLISSPVVGQDKDAFVTASGLAIGSGSNVGFADYNNTTEAWSYYQSGTTGSGAFTQGEGHSVQLATAGDVVFTGTFNDADASIAVTNNTNGFNLIGNPYLASVSVSELLNNNGSLLSESTVWLWDQSSSSYVQKNLAADLEIAPGQAFFISANTSGSFSITESMQSHESPDTFQRTNNNRPEINLVMTNGEDTSDTDIFYIDGTTTGFDNGYDSSIFAGVNNDFVIYTHAVANGTGRNLGIQSLPDNNFENMVIPVGINALSGNTITIEASTNSFPEGMNIYLEDTLDNSFTLLDANSNFSTTLENDLNGIGRFYLYTTSSVLGAEVGLFISEVSDASSGGNEFIEFFNNSSSSISMSSSKLVMLSSEGSVETIWDFDDDIGTATVPPGGFLIITQGNNQTTFEEAFGSLNANTVFIQGTTAMYFGTGTARRWRIYEGGSVSTANGTLIDDTDSSVGGSNNRHYQNVFTGTYNSDSRDNASPGELEYLVYTSGGWINSTAMDVTTGAKDAYIYGDYTITSDADANNVGINTGTTLTLNSSTSLDVNSDLTINGNFNINSGGSLKVNGSSTGNITYNRTLATDNWYLISSPVVGQDKDAFVTASGFASGSGSNVGFADYNNTTEAWSYYQSGTTGSGAFTQGEGHSVQLATAGDVVFTGTFNDADASIAVTNNTNGFNLIGNPYLASVSVSELLGQANITDLLSELTVWLWDQSLDSYVQKNLVADLEIAPGQAFFISAKTAGSFGITESMQSHSADTFQRTVAKPEVELSLSNGKASRTASIYYIDGTTTGFDNGYDSSIFGGFDNDFSIYTHAVANGTGRNLGIQSLPKGEYQNMIIPVGVIAESGSSLEFSASSENLPEGIKIYLEDREENTFIRLDALNASYKLTTESAINGVGRFYLYTTSSALSTDDIALNNNLSIYTSSKENLRVVGVQNGTATIQLHTILGKEVLRKSFKGNGVNDIALPILTNGTYIVKLVTKTGITNKKIIIQ